MSNAKQNFSTANNLEYVSFPTNPSRTSLAPVQVLEAVGLIAVIVGSVILNSLVCGVIWRTKPLRRRPTNIFILNLAISNALVALCVIPFSFQAVIKKAWEHSAVFCQVNGLSSMTFCISSIATLCCISIDRYYAVVRPMRYKHMLTRNRAIYMLLVVWLLAVLFSSIPLFGWAEYTYNPGTNHCSPSWKSNCGYYIFMACTVFVIPILILIVAYGKIFITVRRHERRVSHWNIRQPKAARPRYSFSAHVREINSDVKNSSKSSSSCAQVTFSENQVRLFTRNSRTNSLPQIKHNLIFSDLERASDNGLGRERIHFSPTTDMRDDRKPLDLPSLDSNSVRPRAITLSPKSSRAGSDVATMSVPMLRISSPSFMLRIRTLTQISKRFRTNVFSMSKEYKIAKTGLLLVFVFFLSWGPYMIANNCSDSYEPPLWVNRLSMWLVYVSCVLNPLVYAFSSRHIQEAFASRILCCRVQRWRKVEDIQVTRSGVDAATKTSPSSAS